VQSCEIFPTFANGTGRVGFNPLVTIQVRIENFTLGKRRWRGSMFFAINFGINLPFYGFSAIFSTLSLRKWVPELLPKIVNGKPG
jgi:hypothetical protein